jgi:hypothetical protein
VRSDTRAAEDRQVNAEKEDAWGSRATEHEGDR